MSSFALKGFLTGLAKGVSSNLAEERKQTKENLAFQLKSSYENMQKYNETVSAMEADIVKRDQELLQYAPNLSVEKRIAASSMPDLISVFKKLREQGVDVPIEDLINVGHNVSGGTFETWLSSIRNKGLTPPDKTGFVVSKAGFFTPSTERQQEMVQQMSTALGTTPEQLAQFKTMPTLPSLSGYGSFNPEFTAKLVKQRSIDDQLTDVRGRYAQVASTKGEDSPEAKELFDLNNKLTNYKKNLDPKEADWASTVSALKQQKYEAELAGNKPLIAEVDAKISAALKAHAALTPKTEKETQESLGALRGVVKDSIANRLRRQFGELWQSKGLVIGQDGSVIYGRMDPKQLEQVRGVEAEAVLSALDPWIKDGVPINDRVRSILNSYGFTFDRDGRVIRKPVAPQPSPAPQEAPRGGSAAPVPSPTSPQQPQGVPRNPISEKAGPATPPTQRSFTEDPSTWSEEKGFLREPDGEWVEPSKDPKTGAILIDPRTGKPRYTAYRKGRNPDLPMIGSKEILAYAYKNQISYAEAYRELVGQKGHGTNGT